MKNIWIYLERHKREYPSGTSVRSIAYNDREELDMYHVKPDLLQIGLRLDSETPLIRNLMGDEEYENHFPHVVIKKPGVACRIDRKSYTQAFYFTYNRASYEMFKSRKMLNGPSAWDISISPRIRFFLGEMTNMLEHTNDYGVADRLDQFALLLFQELLLLRDSGEHEPGGIRTKLTQIASYLQVHYKDNIVLGHLPKKFGLSRRSLFRYWKQYFGNTPGQYIANLKMKEAEYLLLETRKSVEEISEIFKYSSAYFCAVFRNCYGCTPLQFRKSKGNIHPRRRSSNYTTV